MASRSARAVRSLKTRRAERRPVERAVGLEEPAPKRSTTRGEPGARRDGLAREPIGVDDRGAQRGEPREAVRLPCRDAAGQSRAAHASHGDARGRPRPSRCS